MYKVQNLTIDSVEQLVALEKQCFGQTAWNYEMLHSEFNNVYSHFFGVIVENQIVAYCDLQVIFDEGNINNIAVVAKYRKLGLATAMMEYMQSYAKGQGVVRLTLEVNSCNISAIQLYKKFGFGIIATRKNYYMPTEEYSCRDAYIMAKDI